jgi:transcriptional antiterminator NusG
LLGSPSNGETVVHVHTFSGFEQKTKAALEERVRAAWQAGSLRRDPRADGKSRRVSQGEKEDFISKFFPGYILVQMELNDETWHVVKETPKVTGFGRREYQSAIVSDEEVRAITQQMEEGAIKPKPRVSFSVGENVKVVDGPFADFNGVVEEVKPG